MKRNFICFHILVLLLVNFSCYAAEKSAGKNDDVLKNVQIVLDDGKVYKMNDGEKMKWDFFVKNTPETRKITSILISTEKGVQFPNYVRVKITLAGETSPCEGLSWFEKQTELVDNAIVATKDALGLLVQKKIN
jgi:hypothetical protein